MDRYRRTYRIRGIAMLLLWGYLNNRALSLSLSLYVERSCGNISREGLLFLQSICIFWTCRNRRGRETLWDKDEDERDNIIAYMLTCYNKIKDKEIHIFNREETLATNNTTKITQNSSSVTLLWLHCSKNENNNLIAKKLLLLLRKHTHFCNVSY